MLPDKFLVVVGASPLNQLGVVHGGEDQHARETRRGSFGTSSYSYLGASTHHRLSSAAFITNLIFGTHSDGISLPSPGLKGEYAFSMFFAVRSP
jgi:hypothetical protein